MCFPRRDNVVVRLVLLEHGPHRFHVFFRITPIALRREVAEVELLLQPGFNACNRTSDLPRDKSFTSPGTFMVKKNSAASKNSVRLTIVNRRPMSVQLCRTVRATRIERCALRLRSLLYFAEHFRAAGLIKLRVNARLTNSFKNAHIAYSCHVSRSSR